MVNVAFVRTEGTGPRAQGWIDNAACEARGVMYLVVLESEFYRGGEQRDVPRAIGSPCTIKYMPMATSSPSASVLPWALSPGPSALCLPSALTRPASPSYYPNTLTPRFND